jgi:pyrimidine operon attenuation protein/uracil phosphoribosyltransferase
MQNIILNTNQIEAIIQRIAYQIYETFVNENEEVVIAGIASGGYWLAENIAKEVQKISPLKVQLCEIKMNKKDVFAPIETNLDTESYANKCLVLVDDVLNTGQTLIYAIQYFLQVPTKKFKTVVLVDRNHKKYPVKADFKGISLSTSSHENVWFAITPNGPVAYLD